MANDELSLKEFETNDIRIRGHNGYRRITCESPIKGYPVDNSREALALFLFLLGDLPSHTFEKLNELLQLWAVYKSHKSLEQIIKMWGQYPPPPQFRAYTLNEALTLGLLNGSVRKKGAGPGLGRVWSIQYLGKEGVILGNNEKVSYQELRDGYVFSNNDNPVGVIVT